MNRRFYRRIAFVVSSFIISLILGGQVFFPSLFANFYPTVAQAQAAPPEQEEALRVLSPDEFSLLNLSPDLDALIPEGLGESRHPRDARGIIDEDDRVEMLSQRYPWSAIGRVDFVAANGGQGSCSGALIAPEVVLTNAHCVMNPGTQVFHQRMAFLPNLVNGRVRDEADVANVAMVWAGTDFTEDNSPPNAEDWAFLKLDRPLADRYGTLPLMPLPIRQLVEDYAGQVVMVGYSGDYPRDNPGATASAHLGCSVLGFYEGSLAHECDTFGGSSGGPMLAWIDDQPYIVGVNSAEWVNTDNIVDTFVGEDGEERPVYEGIRNFGVDVARIITAIERNGTASTR